MSEKLEHLEERVEQLEEQLTVQDDAGREVSVPGLLDMGLSRRQALVAIGLVASGAAIPHAITKAVSRAQAGTGNTLSGVDQIGTSGNPVDTLYVNNLNSFNNTESFTRVETDELEVLQKMTGALPMNGNDITNAGAVDADSATINNQTGIGVPDSASSISATLGGGWTQESSSRPVLLVIRVELETDGTSDGTVAVDVDDSGGTTADRTHFVFANANAGSGYKEGEVLTVYLAPGAQYKISNSSDPNSNNAVKSDSYKLPL